MPKSDASRLSGQEIDGTQSHASRSMASLFSRSRSSSAESKLDLKTIQKPVEHHIDAVVFDS